MEPIPWIAAVVAVSLLGVVLLGWMWVARRTPRVTSLPTEWSLSARPVFSTDERRVYKLIREALPHHVVLSKLPLVRFCQPSDPAEVRYWYELLGSIHVTFAVCSANGRVLAAIDLDTDRASSRRVLQIKQSVLGACRVRYLRCPVDNLPSAAELQLLVPSATASSRSQAGASAPSDLDEARDSLSSTVASRRAQRTALWQDSSRFQDSFFAPDSRQDFGNSEFSSPPRALAAAAAARTGSHSGPGVLNGYGPAASGDDSDEGGAVVVDSTPTATAFSRSRH
ncbi:MAG: DUF2726 domain-containing protein [Caldimonas sp.]